MPREEHVMDQSALLSAIAILIHAYIEELNPAAAGEEYYDCEPLDCASGIGIALDSEWIVSKGTRNEDGSWSDLFLIKLTPKGRMKIEGILVAINSYTKRTNYLITRDSLRETRFERILKDD